MKSRYFLLLALLPLAPGLASPAVAGTRDDVMSAATRCAGITDDRIWLDCYYGAAQPMRAQLGLIPAPASQTARVPSPPGAARVFSVPPPPPGAPARPVSGPPITRGLMGGLFGASTENVKMASYRFDKHGMFTVTLTNGQAWEQMPDDVNYAHWRGAASNYKVNVAEGGFGHAELTVENDGQTYDVRLAH
jgi:hypothetical protein